MTNDNVGSLGNNEIVAHFDDEKDYTLTIQLQRIEDVPGCLVLYLAGYIDTYTANNFQKRVAKAIEAGFISLIFHIAELNFVSSTEIGCYTAFLKAVKPLGGDLVLLEMPPKVYEVYQLLGFSQFFNITEDIEEAVALFSPIKEDAKSNVFPRLIKCPICKKKSMATTSGHLRCLECKTILSISDSGKIFMG